jgi:hypothetical protein
LKLFQHKATPCLLPQGCLSPPSASSIVLPVMVASQNDGSMTSKSHLTIVAHRFEPKDESFLNLFSIFGKALLDWRCQLIDVVSEE